MKITFARMGNIHVPVGYLLRELGHEVVIPPKCTRRTLDLGTRHSPESLCMPFKINMGNYIEALELGADTILMAGGSGPCRFGFYGHLQKEILRDLGYRFDMIILEPPQGHFYELLSKISRLKGGLSWRGFWSLLKRAWRRAKACDQIERAALLARATAQQKAMVSRMVKKWLKRIEQCDVESDIDAVGEQGYREIVSLAENDAPAAPKVGLVGEIYTLLEPFANYNIERQLGEMGVAVERTIYISDWVREHVIRPVLRMKKDDSVKLLARPYVKHFIGGHGLESIGKTVEFARKGYDGVIHVLPFTCMPEIIAQSVMPEVGRDYGIPVLTLVLDEHSSEVGVRTRLEAFVDLVSRKRKEVSSSL